MLLTNHTVMAIAIVDKELVFTKKSIKTDEHNMKMMYIQCQKSKINLITFKYVYMNLQHASF